MNNGRTKLQVLVDPSEHTCPACGRSDRWEGVEVEEDPGHNPAIIVWCDCGLGELKIIVECSRAGAR